MIEDRSEPLPREDAAPDEAGSSLQAPQGPGGLPAPLAAMAEALRANAEALHRIDASQRRMAETMARTDRSQQVITSTRALNETFRGLSDIQRGLLEAVVNRRGRGPSPAILVLGLLAVAVLAGLLGYLAADRWLRAGTVDRAVLEEARRESERFAGRAGDLERRLSESAERESGLAADLKRKEQELASLARDLESERKQRDALEQQVEAQSGRLAQFLAVQARAELAGELQQRNLILERDVRDLREKLDRANADRLRLMEFLGGKMFDGRSLGDPEAVLREAKRRGLIREPEPPPEPGDPVVRLQGREKRRLLDQLNRLLPDAEDAWELLEVGAVEEGWKLRDVTLARYELGRMVSSLKCEQLEIRVDVERRTVELRLLNGAISNNRRPGEKIPIGEDGHSIFLKQAGLQDWLRRHAAGFEVGAKGRLTWKSGTS